MRKGEKKMGKRENYRRADEGKDDKSLEEEGKKDTKVS